MGKLRIENGKRNVFMELQLAKQDNPIEKTPSGSSKHGGCPSGGSVSRAGYTRHSSLIVLRLAGRRTSVRDTQWEKHSSGSLISVATARSTLRKEQQLAKAATWRSVTLAGSTTSSSA
eukprot:scaffold106323_cov28-Tisochrysis_lutea.AAC.2